MIGRDLLRQRVIDICNGAGLEWDTKNYRFEYHRSPILARHIALRAFKRAFKLSASNKIYSYSRKAVFSDINISTRLVAAAIAEEFVSKIKNKKPHYKLVIK